jgi:hypothetical protein
MNDLLKKHFTEEEFNTIKNNGKKTGLDLGYLCKELSRKKIPNGFKRNYPGGPDEQVFSEIIESVYLINYFDGEENFWRIEIRDGHGMSGYSGTSGEIPRFQENPNIFYGFGDVYGELKPFSESKRNNKAINNLKITDRLENNFLAPVLIYLREQISGGLSSTSDEENKFVVEIWRSCCVERHNSNHAGDLIMTEKEILNNYLYKK